MFETLQNAWRKISGRGDNQACRHKWIEIFEWSTPHRMCRKCERVEVIESDQNS